MEELINFDKPIIQQDKRINCQLCKKQINVPIERIYFVKYGELAEGFNFLGKKREKGAKICQDCCAKIDNYIVGLKR